MNILSSYTPNIEIYSIDEAFLEFKGFQEYDLEVYCKEIQKKVLKWTGIPISIGIAPTKALAKVANRISKKFPRFARKVFVIIYEDNYFVNKKILRASRARWAPPKVHPRKFLPAVVCS